MARHEYPPFNGRDLLAAAAAAFLQQAALDTTVDDADLDARAGGPRIVEQTLRR